MFQLMIFFKRFHTYLPIHLILKMLLNTGFAAAPTQGSVSQGPFHFLLIFPCNFYTTATITKVTKTENIKINASLGYHLKTDTGT